MDEVECGYQIIDLLIGLVLKIHMCIKVGIDLGDYLQSILMSMKPFP